MPGGEDHGEVSESECKDDVEEGVRVLDVILFVVLILGIM